MQKQHSSCSIRFAVLNIYKQKEATGKGLMSVELITLKVMRNMEELTVTTQILLLVVTFASGEKGSTFCKIWRSSLQFQKTMFALLIGLLQKQHT